MSFLKKFFRSKVQLKTTKDNKHQEEQQSVGMEDLSQSLAQPFSAASPANDCTSECSSPYTPVEDTSRSTTFFQLELEEPDDETMTSISCPAYFQNDLTDQELDQRGEDDDDEDLTNTTLFDRGFFEATIPLELLEIVFSFGSFEDLLSISTVCKRWSSVVSNDEMWRSAYLRRWGIGYNKEKSANWSPVFHDQWKKSCLWMHFISLRPDKVPCVCVGDIHSHGGSLLMGLLTSVMAGKRGIAAIGSPAFCNIHGNVTVIGHNCMRPTIKRFNINGQDTAVLYDRLSCGAVVIKNTQPVNCYVQ